MRPRPSLGAVVLCLAAAAPGACASKPEADPSPERSRDVVITPWTEDEPAALVVRTEPAVTRAVLVPEPAARATAVAATPAPSAPVVRPAPEPWPPAEVRNAGREPATGEMVEIPCPPGGLPVLDLIRLVSEKTGAVIAYDTTSNTKFKTARVEFSGSWRVPTSRLIDALRTALFPHSLVAVRMNLGDGGEGWFVYDLNHPAVKASPVFIPEEEVFAHERSDGMYIVTTLRVRDIVDTGRLRQALTTMTTQTASIGRIQDIPGGRHIVVGDFAPIVAAMKRMVDEINRLAVPEAALPAPARGK